MGHLHYYLNAAALCLYFSRWVIMLLKAILLIALRTIFIHLQKSPIYNKSQLPFKITLLSTSAGGKMQWYDIFNLWVDFCVQAAWIVFMSSKF